MLSEKLFSVKTCAVEKKGIFYAGGSYTGEVNDHFVCNQMFVEVYSPKKISCSYPIIMFHGAGQTNVNWLTTPDGREGWADYFLTKGYQVCLAEQPARGRSAYHPQINGPITHHPVEVLKSRFISDDGDWPQSKKHTQWPGNASDWNAPSFRQFTASQVEYLPRNQDSQKLVLNAAEDLFKKTGPAILLTHSQAGPFGWLLADHFPEYVKAIVAVEPFGPPFSNRLDAPVAVNYGLADLPLSYDPPVQSYKDLKLALLEPDDPNLKTGWVFQQDQVRRLPNLAGIPILILTGEASYHAQYDHLTSHVLRQCGVDHDFVRLEQVGIHGNGHMMMLEKNNLEIAEWIHKWLTEHLQE